MCITWVPPAAGLRHSVCPVASSLDPSLRSCWYLGVQIPKAAAGTDALTHRPPHLPTPLPLRAWAELHLSSSALSRRVVSLLDLSASLVLPPHTIWLSGLKIPPRSSPLLVHRRESFMRMNGQVGGHDWVGGYWFWWLLVPQLLLLMTGCVCCIVATSVLSSSQMV